MTMPIGSLYSMPYMPFGFGNTFDSYSNQVMLNDMTGFNLFTPPFNMPMMPGFSMNDSIFNSMSYNMNMPVAPSFTGDYNQSMEQYYEKMMENQVKYQKKSREADISINAAQRNMRQKGLQLHEKIELNERDQIIPAFNEYLNSIRSYYGEECSEEDLLNTALQHYEEQFQKTIQKDIRENCSGSFMSGLKQVGLLGFADKTSAEENVAKITGQQEGKSEKLWKSAGNATAGAVWGLAAGTAIPHFGPKVPILNKFVKPGGNAKITLGLAVGAAAGWLLGKIFNNN